MHSDAITDAGEIAMKAITIRNLPDMVADAVHAKAGAEHLSISKAIVALLEEHHGESKVKIERSAILVGWLGRCLEEDARAFDECLKDQRRIDPEMWK